MVAELAKHGSRRCAPLQIDDSRYTLHLSSHPGLGARAPVCLTLMRGVYHMSYDLYRAMMGMMLGVGPFTVITPCMEGGWARKHGSRRCAPLQIDDSRYTTTTAVDLAAPP